MLPDIDTLAKLIETELDGCTKELADVNDPVPLLKRITPEPDTLANLLPLTNLDEILARLL
jgi:hypothetical protein